MAWVEQRGKYWRVRYRDDSGTYGSVSGFISRRAADEYAADLEVDRRRGAWIDPAGARTRMSEWVGRWIETVDVESRTEENYRRCLRLHIVPRWGSRALGEIKASAVAEWLKQLRRRYAISTVNTIRTVISVIMEDAVEERLVPVNPVPRRRRRGRRFDSRPPTRERVWAMPEQVVRIAEQAGTLGGPSAELVVITAAWTGCRWGELAGLRWDNVTLELGTITIDPEAGSLHESAHGHWLGPPKTPASARTISLPPFLVALLRQHQESSRSRFVFTGRRGAPLWRSTFDRRVFRPAVDGDHRRGTVAVRAGLTFHGLRHSHKTWLIADRIPEIAQAKRLGHHLPNRLVEVYSHVAPEVERQLLRALERRWTQAAARPRYTPVSASIRRRDPHSAPTLNTATRHRPRLPNSQVSARAMAGQRHAWWEHTTPISLPAGTRRDHRRLGLTLTADTRKALRPATTP